MRWIRLLVFLGLVSSCGLRAQEDSRDALREASDRLEGFYRSSSGSAGDTSQHGTGGSIPQAEFIGGQSALSSYIAHTLHYPDSAYVNDISGTVYVEFTVAADGRVEGARIRRGIHALLDAEALRVVGNMPPWQPATLAGKTVAARHVLPIRFEQRR